jgi:hypothetical protein
MSSTLAIVAFALTAAVSLAAVYHGAGLLGLAPIGLACAYGIWKG